MLKLCQGNSKPLNNDNVLQIKLKPNLSLDKLQTTLFYPSLVMAFFLPIDNHPTLANWNPKSGLTHTHNPRIGSDLRSHLLLRGYQCKKFFFPCTLATASGMERKTADSYLTPSYIGHMVLAKEKDYTE